MLQYLADVLVKRHAAIAGSLFAASAIGSFLYTVNYGRSAFIDAHTLIAGGTCVSLILLLYIAVYVIADSMCAHLQMIKKMPGNAKLPITIP